ncbi:MAG: 4Fe-4S binding protein [Desulfuromonadaceae bacterium]|nr:4Fe-4S binding protein [Desulfuromonadaceae bacterium]
MKEIVIISGKGGTGKTSFTASMAALFDNKVVADCDVDAANLNLVLNAAVVEEYEFVSGHNAAINKDICTSCGKCREVCHYQAISENYQVDRFSCEGCGACFYLCPAGAVSFNEALCGHYFAGKTKGEEWAVFAELLPGAENSGKLVTAVRKKAGEITKENGNEIILTDGPPGIGCTVIASLTGASYIVFVTEPTVSGVHDLKRVMELSTHFKLPGGVVINKGDLNPTYAKEIENLCLERGFSLLGSIPYEPLVSKAQRQAKTILEYAPDCQASEAIRQIYKQLYTQL